MRRLDPILPTVASVREYPTREAGRLAFGGLLDADRELPDAQLPLLPMPEGPRVPLLELQDNRGVPTMRLGPGSLATTSDQAPQCVPEVHLQQVE